MEVVLEENVEFYDGRIKRIKYIDNYKKKNLHTSAERVINTVEADSSNPEIPSTEDEELDSLISKCKGKRLAYELVKQCEKEGLDRGEIKSGLWNWNEKQYLMALMTLRLII